MLAEAKREAERIIKEARERQERLVGDEEVTKQAERAAEDIIEEARARERENRLGAEDYAERSSTRSRSTSRSSSPPCSADASACRARTSRPGRLARTAGRRRLPDAVGCSRRVDLDVVGGHGCGVVRGAA